MPKVISRYTNPAMYGDADNFEECIEKNKWEETQILKYNPNENMKSITDIPAIKKYIAQRNWRKLCILFKLYPHLLKFLNEGYYLVRYEVTAKRIPDIIYIGGIKTKYRSGQHYKFTLDLPGFINYNKWFNYREGSSTKIIVTKNSQKVDESKLSIVIKKDNFNPIAENIIKDILIKHNYEIN